MSNLLLRLLVLFMSFDHRAKDLLIDMVKTRSHLVILEFLKTILKLSETDDPD